jgi:prevent-host-death family protein
MHGAMSPEFSAIRFQTAIFTVQQAKAQLSQLIERAEAGEETIIARRDKPAVKLARVEARRPRERAAGAWKGRSRCRRVSSTRFLRRS